MPPIPAYAAHAILFSLSPPYMSLAAQTKRSCTLNVISVSGSTAGRRNILSNCRTKGAPVTGEDAPATVFETMVISCTFVGSCRMSSHFSICSLDCAFCARCTEMMTTIFTSPSDSVSHQLASNLRRGSDSDTPDSMTIVGQSVSFGRKE